MDPREIDIGSILQRLIDCESSLLDEINVDHGRRLVFQKRAFHILITRR